MPLLLLCAFSLVYVVQTIQFYSFILGLTSPTSTLRPFILNENYENGYCLPGTVKLEMRNIFEKNAMETSAEIQKCSPQIVWKYQLSIFFNTHSPSKLILRSIYMKSDGIAICISLCLIHFRKMAEKSHKQKAMQAKDFPNGLRTGIIVR